MRSVACAWIRLGSVACTIVLGLAILEAETTYLSPGALSRATVTTDRSGESITKFFDVKSTHLLYLKDDRSKDGAHRLRVVHAEWTADGEFFIASLENTGGHQPWSRPIWIYSRYENRVVDLGKQGVFAVADFHLSDTDALRTRARSSDPLPNSKSEAVCRDIGDFFPEDKRVHVASNLRRSGLIHYVPPEYPPALKRRHISGVVRFDALVGTDGRIEKLSLVQGLSPLVPYAEKAARQWRYEPNEIGCTPVQSKITIDVSFIDQ